MMHAHHRPVDDLDWDHSRLAFGDRTLVMGILNVTPDSFSDGGRFLASDDAVAHGLRLVAEGADILDIGGESTRPFSDPIGVEEELDRVLPVIEALVPQISAPISIDTQKAAVAHHAIAAGAAMVNDISALRADPKMGDIVAQTGVPLILMHMRGTPQTMQVDPVYQDLMHDLTSFFVKALEKAEAYGISRARCIIDPGIGFGKTFTHNLQVLGALQALTALRLPIMVGPSRKAFIRNLLRSPDTKEPAADTPIVETGTQAAVAAAVLNGAHIVRVHDVANTTATLKVIDAIKKLRPTSTTAMP